MTWRPQHKRDGVTKRPEYHREGVPTARWFAPDGEPKGLVVLLHGNNGEAVIPVRGWANYVSLPLARGWAVLSLRSPGQKWDPDADHTFVNSMVTAHQAAIRAEAVAVVGFSNGTGMATKFAAMWGCPVGLLCGAGRPSVDHVPQGVPMFIGARHDDPIVPIEKVREKSHQWKRRLHPRFLKQEVNQAGHAPIAVLAEPMYRHLRLWGA